MRYLGLLVLIFLTACDSSRVYEDYEEMDDAYWHMDSIQAFTFDIANSEASYNLLATFRNSSAYPFYNIYFQFTLTDSLDSVLVQQLTEADLFDSTTGQPKGSGLGDMFDHSVPLLEGYTFTDPGVYTIKLQQQMRLDTLPFVLSVGARVELVEE